MTLRALTAASARGALGDRAMVRLEPRVVTVHRVEWEYDGHQASGDFDHETGCPAEIEPCRRVRVKFFRNKGAAYNWMALRLIFARRNELATRLGESGHPEGCRLCDALPARAPDDEPLCRYHEHGGEEFVRIRARLVRWLKWRDARLAELAKP